MKVVLDTNVIVSAAITTYGTCGQIVDMLTDGIFDICADDRILNEYETVLHRPELQIIPQEAAIVLELIHSIAERVAAVPLAVTLPDPKDLLFLEVATTAEAILVTGNLRHFPKRACKGVIVVSPREFLNLFRQSGHP